MGRMKGPNGSAGFVPRKSPGSLPGVYVTTVERPSLARNASVPSATSLPTASPFALAPLSGSALMYDAHAGSYCGARLGNSPRSTPQAAAAAAALVEAPVVGEAGVVANGSYPPRIETTASYMAMWTAAMSFAYTVRNSSGVTAG